MKRKKEYFREERQLAHDQSKNKWLEIKKDIKSIYKKALEIRVHSIRKEVILSLDSSLEDMLSKCGFCNMRTDLGRNRDDDTEGNYFTCDCPIVLPCNSVRKKVFEKREMLYEYLDTPLSKSELLSIVKEVSEIYKYALRVLDEFENVYLNE